MDSTRFRNVFLVLLVVAISLLFVTMIKQFLMTILLAAIFSALLQRPFTWLDDRLQGRSGFAAAVTLLIFAIVIVVPVLSVIAIVTSQAVTIGETAVPWLQKQIADPTGLEERFQEMPVLRRLAPYREPILEKAGQLVGTASTMMVRALSAATKGTFAFFFHLGLMLYTMFFFLKDGRMILMKILYYIPMEHDDEIRMLEKFVSVTRATIKGTLIIGLVQGGAAGIALAIAGIGGAAFWTALMVLLSIIPGVGVAIVWVPAVAYLVSQGAYVPAALLAVWCGGVVGMVDNVLRPRLVGQDTKMHDLLILFSTLGGMLLFGVVGFIIGPVIAALFVTVWEIYGTVFRDALPRVRGL